MIDFFFGKPRTGKSYRAVNLIYNEYIKDDSSPKYSNILTNIGGFNFKKVNQIFLDRGSDSRAYKLEWKKFYIHLVKMYNMALDEHSDEELNKYAYYHNINNSLIVIDEASFYMKKYDDAISWFLAYHGHFKIRLIFIAQNPKQIYPEYLTHTEIYYDAQAQSKQIKSNSLRYIHYSDIPFNKDSKFSSDTLTTKDEVFALYKSGEVDKPKKIIYKFIFIAVLALITIVSLMYYFVNSIKQKAHLDDEAPGQHAAKSVESYSQDMGVSIGHNLYKFRCDDKNCWQPDKKYEHNQVSLNYFKYVILTNNIKLSYFEIANEIFMLKNKKKGQEKITLASNTDYYYLIPDSVKKQYLSKLFIVRKLDIKDNSNVVQNPFTDNSNKSKNRSDE